MIIATVSLLLCVSIIFGQDWYDHFDYNTYLDDHQKFQVFWTPNQESCTIEIGLVVATNSYAAFGISESGGMVGADIVIGWITDENEYILQNRYTTSFNTPNLFSSQDGIKKIDGWKECVDANCTTYLHFEKEMFPDFDVNNVDIKLGTTRIIWAFGDNEMNANSVPTKHCDNCRDAKSINLIQGEIKEVELPSDSEYIDITVTEHLLPSDHTTYYCSLYQLPFFEQKQHVVRIDPVIDPPENQAVVHHILMYACPEDKVNMTDIGTGWACDRGANMEPHECLGGAIFAAWAIGGTNFWFPENVGLEMSGTDDDAIQYVLVETHYDNSAEEVNIMDRSGLRVHYTPTLREHSASVLHIGMDIFKQFIPHGIAEAPNIGYCSVDCLTSGIENEEEELYAFANVLHMHTLGSQQIFRHVRNGKELRPLDLNLAYDFDYQQFVPFNEQITIQKGDLLIVECLYDSTDRTEMTYGGLSSQDEMCLSFLYVYPKPKISICESGLLNEDMDRFFFESENNGYYDSNTGQYDVTIEGALDFYVDFQIGNIFQPHAERVARCQDNGRNPLSGDNVRFDVPIPGNAYETYDINNYYQCAVGSDESGFDWNEWYVYTVGVVIGLLLIIFIIYVIKKMKRKNQTAYHRVVGQQEIDYGTNKHDQHVTEISTHKI